MKVSFTSEEVVGLLAEPRDGSRSRARGSARSFRYFSAAHFRPLALPLGGHHQLCAGRSLVRSRAPAACPLAARSAALCGNCLVWSARSAARSLVVCGCSPARSPVRSARVSAFARSLFRSYGRASPLARPLAPSAASAVGAVDTLPRPAG